MAEPVSRRAGVGVIGSNRVLKEGSCTGFSTAARITACSAGPRADCARCQTIHAVEAGAAMRAGSARIVGRNIRSWEPAIQCAGVIRQGAQD